MKKFVELGKLLMKMRNRRGPKIDPCGTPKSIFIKDDCTLLILTNCFREDRYDSKNL